MVLYYCLKPKIKLFNNLILFNIPPLYDIIANKVKLLRLAYANYSGGFAG